MLAICTESRQHQKELLLRHIWKDALEVCEDIRHQSGDEGTVPTPERNIKTRLFGTAKDTTTRYTREKGKSNGS